MHCTSFSHSLVPFFGIGLMGPLTAFLVGQDKNTVMHYVLTTTAFFLISDLVRVPVCRWFCGGRFR